MLDSAMADSKKKTKYLTKSVKFGDKQFTLFSLDGVTWSSRREELHQILERQEQERKAFNQIVGEQAGKEAAEGDDGKEAVVEKLIEAEDEELLPIEEVEAPAKKAKGSAGKKAAALSMSPKGKAPPAKGKASKSKPSATQPVIAAPKSRVSSKPAKKSVKAKAKKKVA